LSEVFRTLTVRQYAGGQKKLVRTYADARTETVDYVPSKRTRRAVDILRERRKTHPDTSVLNLKETLDRLEGEVAQRKAEREAERVKAKLANETWSPFSWLTGLFSRSSRH
jgi:hypothetical protein